MIKKFIKTRLFLGKKRTMNPPVTKMAMGKLFFKASDGGRIDILREGRTPLNVNSGRGLGHKFFLY
jgi:hypothetical protein